MLRSLRAPGERAATALVEADGHLGDMGEWWWQHAGALAMRWAGRGPSIATKVKVRIGDREYPIGYSCPMTEISVLKQARIASGFSQAALAERSGTSRPTLSAYERGRKSPTLDTAVRILAEAGFDLFIAPRVEFHEVSRERGRPIWVPNVLPRLSLEQALATVELPMHLNWSDRGRRYDLRDRQQRARVYEVVLREGGPDDVRGYVDGALLVDLWSELVLPSAIRAAWSAVVRSPVMEKVAAS